MDECVCRSWVDGSVDEGVWRWRVEQWCIFALWGHWSQSRGYRANAEALRGEISPLELLIVQGVDGVLGLARGAEGDETEATRAASITIAHHDRLKQTKRGVRNNPLEESQGTELRGARKSRRAGLNVKVLEVKKDTDVEDLAIV